MDFGLLISKALGYGIIAGSFILQAPQILKIISSGSVAGLSALSYWLQLIGYTISFAYPYNAGFPFSTYGESGIILVQNIVIVYLLYSYRRQINAVYWGMMAAYFVFAYVLISGSVGMSLLALFQGMTIPIFCFSKIPQIYSNFMNKSVGQLSFVTAFLTFAGSAARVFTTLKEVSDIVILSGYVIGTALNGIIILQFLLYWNSKPAKKTVATKRTPNKGH